MTPVKAVLNQSATLMINRGVECFRGSQCYLDGLCALGPLQTDEHAAPHITSAAAAAVAARCLRTGVLCKYEYRWWAIFARVVLLNSWLPVIVCQVISEAEDTGGKTHSLGLESTQQLVCNGWMYLRFLFFINADYEYYYDYTTDSPTVDADTSYDDWIYELLDITGT